MFLEAMPLASSAADSAVSTIDGCVTGSGGEPFRTELEEALLFLGLPVDTDASEIPLDFLAPGPSPEDVSEGASPLVGVDGVPLEATAIEALAPAHSNGLLLTSDENPVDLAFSQVEQPTSEERPSASSPLGLDVSERKRIAEHMDAEGLPCSEVRDVGGVLVRSASAPPELKRPRRVVAEPALTQHGTGKETGKQHENEELEEASFDAEDSYESDDSYVPSAADGAEDCSELSEASFSSVPDSHSVSIFDCIARKDCTLLRRLVSAGPMLLLENDPLERTPLHLILLKGHADMLHAVLALDCQDIVSTAIRTPFRSGVDSNDEIPCLHLALGSAPFDQSSGDAYRCLEALLKLTVVDIDCLDGLGRTALHVACLQGCDQVVRLLLENRAAPCIPDDLGNFPLHYAIDARSRHCIQALLVASDPALFSEELHPFYRCIDRQAWEGALLVYRSGWKIPEAMINRLFDFAAARGLAKEWNFVSDTGLEHSGAFEDLPWPPELSPMAAGATALVTHLACLTHGEIGSEVDCVETRGNQIKQTPENPHRLEVLCGEQGALRSSVFQELRWMSDVSLAPMVDILRVHEYSYIDKLSKVVEAVQKQQLSKSSHVSKGKDGLRRRSAVRAKVDKGDTKVTSASMEAALRACGCVLEAVDSVCNEQVRNAFCAVRPPGHHLGPGGACDVKDLQDAPDGSQGFCLLNNVAVGAAYARCVYRHIIRRVAIVDFDVHHGNGTEAIVRHIRPRRQSFSQVSESLSYNGFGLRVEVTPPTTCKPWLDPESDPHNVFFASVHGYGDGFYPSTGSDCDEAAPRIINVGLQAGSSSSEFRFVWRSKVLQQLLAFDPDIIFVSAGFDGHEGDLIGNAGCVEEDYGWLTQQLVAVANRCCSGRLVSVLEGGYNTRAELLSPFALSVSAHVRALMHTSPSYTYLDFEDQRGAEGLREADRQRCVQRRDVQENRSGRAKAVIAKTEPLPVSASSLAGFQ